MLNKSILRFGWSHSRTLGDGLDGSILVELNVGLSSLGPGRGLSLDRLEVGGGLRHVHGTGQPTHARLLLTPHVLCAACRSRDVFRLANHLLAHHHFSFLSKLVARAHQSIILSCRVERSPFLFFAHSCLFYVRLDEVL